MATTLKKFGHRVSIAVLTASALLCAGQTALAQDKAALDKAAQETMAADKAAALQFKDEHALQVLKGMSDKLAAAKTLSFKFRGIVPTPSPTGQYISLYASSTVLLQRPNKLAIAARGDLFPSDTYYNGKTVTVVGLDKKFYAQRDAAGGALEALMQGQQPDSDVTAPFLDLLVPDSYGILTKDFRSAFWVGQTPIAGVLTDHLAFTAEGLDWEIWIGAADKLPRLMIVSYRTGERQPTFTAEFADWKLNTAVPAQAFEAKIPASAVKLEFKQLGQTK